MADDVAWSGLVERTRRVLTQVAAGCGTITYGELRDRLGPDVVPNQGPRDLAAVLRAVSIAEDEAGRGLLSAVVVRRGGRPGPGFFRLASERGRDVSNTERAWREEIERVSPAARTRRPSPE